MTDQAFKENLRRAAHMIRQAEHVVAFTGAGISVESGVPPFRGPDGIWSRIDPGFAEIGFFRSKPEKSWPRIKEVFFDHIGRAKPNNAHFCLSAIESAGLLHGIITQNIDNLHQKAGSKKVIEFHGNTRDVVCLDCAGRFTVTDQLLTVLPPKCPSCGGLLKPDFVFFGEPIPHDAMRFSEWAVKNAGVWLVIGTSGEVYPASLFPIEAKREGAKIIEVNTSPSNYTKNITDIFLRGPASETLNELCKELGVNQDK